MDQVVGIQIGVWREHCAFLGLKISLSKILSKIESSETGL